MKKLFLGLGLVALLAGCASHQNGMGGTGESYNQSQTDEYNNNNNSSDQFNNNATQGTGTSTATNNVTSR